MINRPSSAPAGSRGHHGNGSSSSAEYDTAGELEAMLELNTQQYRRMKKCDQLAERARQREKAKRQAQDEQERTFRDTVQRQTEAILHGEQQAAAKAKARRKEKARIARLLAEDDAMEELAGLAKEKEKERRAERLAATMQKESGEEEGLTENEWRKRTVAKLTAKQKAEQANKEAMGAPADLSTLADDALADGVVPADLYALHLAEEGSKLSRKEREHAAARAEAAGRLGQDRSARGHDDKLTLALLEYGFLTSGGELLKAAKAKKEAEAMAARALWTAKQAALHRANTLLEKQHRPPREGALGPGTPRPTREEAQAQAQAADAAVAG